MSPMGGDAVATPTAFSRGRRLSIMSTSSMLFSEQFMTPAVEDAIEEGYQGYLRLLEEDEDMFGGPPELTEARNHG